MKNNKENIEIANLKVGLQASKPILITSIANQLTDKLGIKTEE